jgi:predicted TIM-barrel fold metal-dependent hydrolase
MKIDIFTHFFPKRFWDEFINLGASFKDMGKRVQNISTIADLEARFRVMDEFGDYCQILSLPTPPVEMMAGPEKSPVMARMANDGFAEVVSKHPQRFPAFIATLPMNNPDEAVKEMDRAIRQLGAAGVQLYSNAAGKALDAPEFRPIFEFAAKTDTPIWLHPERTAGFSDYATETRSQYEIFWTFGWPYETSVAMARMVFSGFFDRWPNLKVITHHMGAMIPYFEGRVGYGWDQLGTRTSDLDYTGLLKSMKKRPIDYFRQFYADTALFGARAGTQCGLSFFGVDNVVFASDAPFEPTPGLYIRETIRVLDSLELTAAERDRIYRKNAESLLNLPKNIKT